MAHVRVRTVSLAAILFFGGQARATRMVPLDLSALTRKSDTVVLGRVTAQACRWTRSRRRIVTSVTLSVQRFLKGKPPNTKTVTFRHLGGRVGRIEMRVMGAPRFKTGETVVVFLQRRRLRLYVTAMAQGKFTVTTDPRTGRTFLTRNLGGIKWTRRFPKWTPRLSLETLVTRVKQLTRTAARKSTRKQ